MINPDVLEKLEFVKNRLKEIYTSINIGGDECFALENGVIFHVVALGDEFNALVIEYSENAEEYKKNNSEDGDLFFIDMENEEMLQAMIEEIKENL